MKILQKEIDLREETRTVQQARPQFDNATFLADAYSLADTQEELIDRTQNAIESIGNLENAQAFKTEIQQLANAAKAMKDAADVLIEPETGPTAIAAETEAVEWLLQARRGGGGGGGGDSAGNGARQSQIVSRSALARLGEQDGRDGAAKKVERSVRQATGKSGEEFPEEFRFGLDRFFETLEKD